MKILFLFLPFLSYADIGADLTQGPGKADEITYEWLSLEAVQQHDTQHVLIFKRLFELTRVKTLLEFGVGYPTKYFLDRCNKVISVDIITHGYGPETLKKFVRLYADYSNWIPIAFFSGYLGCDYSWAPYKHMASESIYKATAYQHAYHKDYSKLDDFYRIELNAFITNLLKYNKVDAVFAGHACFLRGDVVELMFNKVPIIVAHNTDKRDLEDPDDLYGLSRVVASENYEEIFFPVEGGTTVWILKKERYAGLIDEFKKYAAAI